MVSVYKQALHKQTGKGTQHNKWGKRVKGEHLMQAITCQQVMDKIDRLIE
ncbi:MAG: hypothetical protein Q9M92_01525 [Enterobacterales bacterium]|nr:hypothetical protein [Enterobacterales bacterium]